MRSGKCPKCGNTDIKSEKSTTSKSWSGSIKVHKFDLLICAKCGYTEFYYDRGGLNW